ncbi:hypothetical protein JKP88DRAFT_347015 [Tribonema minus]|uniref:Uncharacterized protein n=1 Tax=Tribonema minus TaxID=303371 RepID=A0A835YP80_9STRA|nr:hypothetical protein JKP88DRAFT_347015 [Tribonema minus]
MVGSQLQFRTGQPAATKRSDGSIEEPDSSPQIFAFAETAKAIIKLAPAAWLRGDAQQRRRIAQQLVGVSCERRCPRDVARAALDAVVKVVRAEARSACAAATAAAGAEGAEEGGEGGEEGGFSAAAGAVAAVLRLYRSRVAWQWEFQQFDRDESRASPDLLGMGRAIEHFTDTLFTGTHGELLAQFLYLNIADERLSVAATLSAETTQRLVEARRDYAHVAAALVDARRDYARVAAVRQYGYGALARCAVLGRGALGTRPLAKLLRTRLDAAAAAAAAAADGRRAAAGEPDPALRARLCALAWGALAAGAQLRRAALTSALAASAPAGYCMTQVRGGAAPRRRRRSAVCGVRAVLAASAPAGYCMKQDLVARDVVTRVVAALGARDVLEAVLEEASARAPPASGGGGQPWADPAAATLLCALAGALRRARRCRRTAAALETALCVVADCSNAQAREAVAAAAVAHRLGCALDSGDLEALKDAFPEGGAGLQAAELIFDQATRDCRWELALLAGLAHGAVGSRSGGNDGGSGAAASAVHAAAQCVLEQYASCAWQGAAPIAAERAVAWLLRRSHV